MKCSDEDQARGRMSLDEHRLPLPMGGPSEERALWTEGAVMWKPHFVSDAELHGQIANNQR